MWRNIKVTFIKWLFGVRIMDAPKVWPGEKIDECPETRNFSHGHEHTRDIDIEKIDRVAVLCPLVNLSESRNSFWLQVIIRCDLRLWFHFYRRVFTFHEIAPPKNRSITANIKSGLIPSFYWAPIKNSMRMLNESSVVFYAFVHVHSLPAGLTVSRMHVNNSSNESLVFRARLHCQLPPNCRTHIVGKGMLEARTTTQTVCAKYDF